MFGRWFGKPSLQSEDRVWLDRAACERGLRTDVARALQDGHAVLLLLRSGIDLDTAARDLSAHAPRVADDHYAASDLHTHLATAGALGLSRVDALRPIAAGDPRRAPLQVHVRARDTRRRGDQRLLELLTPWAPTTLVFHHAFDDALLHAHAAQLKQLLQRLDFGADDAISSALLTRALERVQHP
jgi:hypothetical protein